MSKRRILHLGTGKTGNDLCILQTSVRPCCLFKRGSNDVNLTLVFKRDVLELRMERHGHRGRERPGRGGPDDGIHALTGECWSDLLRCAGKAILYVDTWAGVRSVLDLGFSQSCLIDDAPIDRTQSFVHEAVLNEVKQGA